MGSAESSPETPDSGSDSYDPSVDDAAALEIYRSATKSKSEETPAEPPVKVEDKPPVPVPDPAKPADELDAGDAKLARVLNRIERLENERNAAFQERDVTKAEAERLRARAAVADQHERDLADFKLDPDKFFRKIGWDQKTIHDYIVNGPTAANPQLTAQERELAELKKTVEADKAERAQNAQAAQIHQFKANIPHHLTAVKAELPLLHSFYDQPAELAEAVYGVMAHAYQTQKTDLTVHEAGKLVEQTLKSHLERLDRARSKTSPSNSSNPAPAAKPTTPTLTNSPPVSATPNTSPDQESDEALFDQAVAFLRSKRVAS